MSDNNWERLLKHCASHGASPAHVRRIIGEVTNLCWSADWADLHRLLEAVSGLGKGQMVEALGVKYDTLSDWREGTRLPQKKRFAHYAKVLSQLTGVRPEIMHEARSRSMAAREGGIVPRPGWAWQYGRAGLEISFYLQRLRAEADLSTAEVAGRLGVSQEDYEAWETGQRTPRKWQLPRLWRVLGRAQGVLLCELQAARDTGAQATYDERRRKKQIRLDRLSLFAWEEGCSIREAKRRIERLDEGQWDARYDYDQGCLRPEYVRKMRREMALSRMEPRATADDTSEIEEIWQEAEERFLESLHRPPAQRSEHEEQS